MTNIKSVAELEACIGTTPAVMHMKVIDHLDPLSVRWVEAASLAFVGVAGQEVGVTLAGGPPGFASVRAPTVLVLPAGSIDDAELLAVGRGVGMLFLVAGVGEMLRVNGEVSACSAEEVEITIEEVFIHCAKALLRSEFWAAAPRAAAREVEAFLHDARFVAIATADDQGRTDLSPKGDPSGRMLRLTEAGPGYAERPGNRRADSLRNMLAQPRMAALAVIPGACSVAVVRGGACISADEALRAAFAVEGKVPKLVTTLDGAEIEVRASPALARAAVWPLQRVEHGVDPSAVAVAHVKLNKTTGLAAKLVRATANKTMIGAGLKLDYKTNMY